MGKNQGIIEDCREAENDSVTDDVEQLLIKNLDLKDHLYKGLGPDSTRYRKIFLISQKGRNSFKKKKKKLTTLQSVLLPVSEDSTFLQSIVENGLSELLDKTERGEVLVSIENWLCVKCMTNLARKDWGSLLIADNDTDIEYAEAFKSDLENTKKVLTSKGPRIMGIREEYVFTVLQAELDTIDKTDMHALRDKFKFKKIRKLDIDPLVVYISCHGKTGQNHVLKLHSNNHVLSTRGLKTLLKSIKKVQTFILFMDHSYPTEIMFFSKDRQKSIKRKQINSCESDMTRLFTKYLIEGLNPRGQKENSNAVTLTKKEFITANTLHEYISQQFKRGQDQHRQQKPEFYSSGVLKYDALKIECYIENVTIDFDHDNETYGLDVDLYQTMEDFGDALKQLFNRILMVVVCYLLCCGITKINIGGGHIIRRDFSQLAICETSFFENNIETKPAHNLPEEQAQDDLSDRTAFNDNAVTQLSKDRRIKCIKESENTMIRNTKQSEDSCDPFSLIRRLQYGIQSQTPHEVDVNEEKNIVSLRNKQPVPYDILQFLIEFCKLKKQNNMKTARHFFFQEIESVTANITDLKEIELSGKEVTDSLHRDSQVEDNNLEISAVESLSAATAFKCLLKNNTISVERKRLFFPQNSMERHLYVPTVTPKTSERTDILSGGQRDRMSKDFKYKVAPSMSYKKENEDDRSYFKHNKYASKLWPTPFDETGELIRRLTEIPQPHIDIKYARRIIEVFFVFEPLMNIVDLIALGKPPAPHVSMRYELLRFCTLRSYPKDDKPYLIKLAEAGFYYASDGDGVVCYCCGIRRYNWTADDQPLKIHKRINPTCKFLIKNEEVNVRNNYNGPFSKSLMFIDSILEPEESQEPTEDVNNDWAPERTRSPASRALNNETTGSSSQLGISTAIPKHSQYATKTSRLASFNGWPETASHTPDVLADAGFFFAGFGDCVRCFYCGIGLRHWTQDDNPWIEHARWAKNCVFVKQKKGEEFVNLVQLAVQYSQDNAPEENSGGNQLSPQEIENILLSDAAQSVLDMGYQPRIIKKAVEQIIRQNRQAKITAQFLMEKILEIEEGSNETPGTLVSPGAATSTVGATGITEGATGTSLKESLKESAEPEKKNKGGKPEDKKSTPTKEKIDKEKIITKSNIDVSKDKAPYDPTSQQDPKAIKAENEQLKEQTICKICLDQTVSIVFLPCGHLVTCADCAPAMRKCPICRALVKGTVRTYMS